MGERVRDVESFSVAYDSGPPIWVSSAQKGGPRTGGKAASGPSRVVLRRPSRMPSTFASLRFSPLIIVALGTPRLKDKQRTAIIDAVGSGTKLVISTGEGGALPPKLGRLLDVQIGAGEAPQETLTRFVPRASSRRPLKPGKSAHTVLMDPNGPLITATSYGLGEIRILGLALRELDRGGAVAQSAFAVDGEPLRALIDWLDQSVPLDVGGPMAIGLHVWGAIGLLFALLYLLRHRWVVSSCLCGIWALGAAFLPPNLNETQVDGSRALAVNAGDRTLVVGSIRLSQSTGGARVINAGQWPVSIEASRGGGTCIIGTDDQQKWMFSGRPGQTRRISYLMWLDAKLSGLERVEQLSKLAPAPWAEGTLRRISSAIPIPMALPGTPGETLLAVANRYRPALPLDLENESAALLEKARKRRRLRKSRRE